MGYSENTIVVLFVNIIFGIVFNQLLKNVQYGWEFEVNLCILLMNVPLFRGRLACGMSYKTQFKNKCAFMSS